MTENSDLRARLAAAAENVRASGALGRSDLLIRLFDYLLRCSLAGRAPKEVEIGQEVFSRGSGFDIVQDASVRVYIHRLRKKLDEFHAAAPAGADRISLLRGEYRLTLVTDAADSVKIEPPSPEAAGRRRRPALPWIVLGAIVLINLAGWITFLVAMRGPRMEAAAVAQTNFWKPLSTGTHPTMLVAGDYYIFGESADRLQVTRLVREFSVNSRDDLDTYLMAHPAQIGRFVDVDLHYLPVSVAPALRNLLPVVEAASTEARLRPLVVSMSQLTPEILKNSNVIYLGFLSGLGMLRDPLFAASGFKIGESYDELIDKQTGRRFMSDWDVVTNGKVPHRDYGYLASMPGPSGNRILIVAGTRDPAVIQAAEIATDRAQLAQIAAKAKADAFEALFEVRTLGSLNLGSELMVARPLHTGNVWQPNHPAPSSFPDELNTQGQERRPQ